MNPEMQFANMPTMGRRMPPGMMKAQSAAAVAGGPKPDQSLAGPLAGMFDGVGSTAIFATGDISSGATPSQSAVPPRPTMTAGGLQASMNRWGVNYAPNFG